MELSPRELQIISQGATNACKAQREFIPLPDLVNEGVVWALTHERKIEMWREKGKYGENLLRHSVKQACLTLISRERRRIYKLERGDIGYYTTALVREILPDIFHPEDWYSSSQTGDERVSGISRPSEGNTRLAVLMDVSGAYYSLSDTDQVLLAELHADGGMAIQVVAATLEVNEKTIRRREDRALQRIVDRLGGEPPWWDASMVRSA